MTLMGDFLCDYIVVSYQKSGHTWLRVMLAKVLSLKYNISQLDLDIHKMALFRKEVPTIAISHSLAGIGIHPVDWKKLKFTSIYSKSEKVRIRPRFKNKKIVLLVRDPRDVVVSLFFELTKRHNIYKKDISSFIYEKYSLKKIIRYMNMWQREMERRPKDFLLLKYEDMKKDTYGQLKRVTTFFGIEASEQILKEAVEFGSIENMRNLEKMDVFVDNRLRPRNPKDAESYKVRKGKVGGFTDYLSQNDIEYVNKVIATKLHPKFEY